jgi:hypothetical protein
MAGKLPLPPADFSAALMDEGRKPRRRAGREAMQELLPQMKIGFTQMKCERIDSDLSVPSVCIRGNFFFASFAPSWFHWFSKT